VRTRTVRGALQPQRGAVPVWPGTGEAASGWWRGGLWNEGLDAVNRRVERTGHGVADLQPSFARTTQPGPRQICSNANRRNGSWGLS
jgi:hypothetical protein